MHPVKGRIFLDSLELEQISRCPHSINYLPRILANKHCSRCQAFSETGRFILQRNFKGGNLPSVEGVTKHFAKILESLNLNQHITNKEKVMLADLLVWGKGIADNINMISIASETHLGLYTIGDIIDAVIYDLDTFTIVQFVCDLPHPERVMNYKAIHNSLWLRHNYNIDKNGLMFVKMHDEGLQIHRSEIDVSSSILQNSLEYILSNIDAGNIPWEEKENKWLKLPRVFGEHCWNCMACFGRNNENGNS